MARWPPIPAAHLFWMNHRLDRRRHDQQLNVALAQLIVQINDSWNGIGHRRLGILITGTLARGEHTSIEEWPAHQVFQAVVEKQPPSRPK